MFIDCVVISCCNAWNIAWASCIDVLMFFYMSDWLSEFVLLRFVRLVVGIGVWMVLVCYMCFQFNCSEDTHNIITLLDAEQKRMANVNIQFLCSVVYTHL